MRLWCFGFLLSLSGNALAQIYSADLVSSEWKLSAGPFACSLTHTIPSLGKATLVRKAGSGENLTLETQGKVTFPVGPAGIETLPPVWRNDVLPKALGSFTAVAGNQPISLGAPYVNSIINELNNGLRVMFTSQPVSNVNSSAGLRMMRVVLEAKNFAPAYKNYQQCLNDMITVTFAQVSRTSINYAEKATGLTSSNKADLTRVARYVKADPKVLGIFVDGHSDDSGAPEADDAIAKQEADWVTAFLVEQGIAADKITTRSHGSKFAIADNKAAAGRAQNRRVTVRLEDEAARKEAEKKAAQAKAEQASSIAANPQEKPVDTGSSSSKSKMSPEEISRMVEGLDLLKK